MERGPVAVERRWVRWTKGHLPVLCIYEIENDKSPSPQPWSFPYSDEIYQVLALDELVHLGWLLSEYYRTTLILIWQRTVHVSDDPLATFVASIIGSDLEYETCDIHIDYWRLHSELQWPRSMLRELSNDPALLESPETWNQFGGTLACALQFWHGGAASGPLQKRKAEILKAAEPALSK